MMNDIFTRAQNKFNYFFKPKAIVLSYHRIADVPIDPWQLAVTPANFKQHLEVLKKYKLFKACDIVDHVANGTIKKGMVCITFDDGYRDNYIHAKPLLSKYGFPWTVFIPTHYIGCDRLFWWDELQATILGPHDLPEKLSIAINEKKINFDLGTDAKYDSIQWEKIKSWLGNEPPSTKRSELFLELWKKLRPLPHEQIRIALDKIKEWSSISVLVNDLDLPVRNEELNQLSCDPLVEIGIHTRTHPALALLNTNTQYQEISECKKQLLELGDHNAQTIAYPYGIYNSETISVSTKLGLKGGFTTESKCIAGNDHPFKLGRFHVKNWNGEDFEKHLSFWLHGFKF